MSKADDEAERIRRLDQEFRKSIERLEGFENMSNLGEAAIAFHELFLALVQGGFTDRQALLIIAYGIFGGLSDDGIENNDGN